MRNPDTARGHGDEATLGEGGQSGWVGGEGAEGIGGGGRGFSHAGTDGKLPTRTYHSLLHS